MAKFGVVGSGEVGQELAKGLRDIGHEVQIGSRDPKKLADFTARAIEPLAVLWCIPGFREDRWTHAFKLLTR